VLLHLAGHELKSLRLELGLILAHLALQIVGDLAIVTGLLPELDVVPVALFGRSLDLLVATAQNRELGLQSRNLSGVPVDFRRDIGDRRVQAMNRHGQLHQGRLEGLRQLCDLRGRAGTFGKGGTIQVMIGMGFGLQSGKSIFQQPLLVLGRIQRRQSMKLIECTYEDDLGWIVFSFLELRTMDRTPHNPVALRTRSTRGVVTIFDIIAGAGAVIIHGGRARRDTYASQTAGHWTRSHQ